MDAAKQKTLNRFCRITFVVIAALVLAATSTLAASAPSSSVIKPTSIYDSAINKISKPHYAVQKKISLVVSGHQQRFARHAPGQIDPHLRRLHQGLGTIYFRARQYDPTTGEFTSRDPLEYVDGMSMMRGYFAITTKDPFGNCIEVGVTEDGQIINQVTEGCKEPNGGFTHMSCIGKCWYYSENDGVVFTRCPGRCHNINLDIQSRLVFDTCNAICKNIGGGSFDGICDNRGKFPSAIKRALDELCKVRPPRLGKWACNYVCCKVAVGVQIEFPDCISTVFQKDGRWMTKDRAILQCDTCCDKQDLNRRAKLVCKRKCKSFVDKFHGRTDFADF